MEVGELECLPSAYSFSYLIHPGLALPLKFGLHRMISDPSYVRRFEEEEPVPLQFILCSRTTLKPIINNKTASQEYPHRYIKKEGLNLPVFT